MNAIDAVVEPPDESAQRDLEAALEDIAKATSFYDFEDAWTSGLRMVPASDGNNARDRVLATAGRRLSSLGELQDDVARRGWLRHVADEVQLRGDDRLGADLKAVTAAELREAFARAADDLSELRESIAPGESLNEFAARRPRPADRVRDLGRIAESLRGSGLLALCSEEDCELARDLARAMKPPVHLVPNVPESLRVSRDDLIRWAKSGHADKEFPRLVRSLIAETEPSAEWIDMPAGTGVALSGLDGVVKCSRGNRFVPVSKSVWELTTQQSDTHAKAADDYTKRIKNLTPGQRPEIAYVSAACAPWTKRRTFESERSGTDDFGRVSALNVDNLEDWLACAVATTIWMREQIGKPTAGIRLLSRWWENWLAATTTPLDEGLVLAGRAQLATDLRDRCRQNPGVVTIGGEVHRDEITAFVAAALDVGDAEHMEGVHVLYVDSHGTAERLFAQEALSIPQSQPSSGPVLTMVVPSTEYATHLPAGSPHRMIVPVPGSPQAAITLNPVDSEVVAKRLQSAGFEPHEAHELGGVARTSLMALRRRLAKEPALHTPDWAKEHIDAPLRRCLLIGSWNETREGDREVVARFAGIPYDKATEMLRKLDRADAPLAAVDQQWYGVSRADTWVLLRDQLTPDDIKEFDELAHTVLTDPDPLRELTGEDALRAQLDGVKAKTSSRLKRGIATTLALAGSLPLGTVAGTSRVSGMANRVTLQALRSAMDDLTHRTWMALVDVLPLLAEAAPDAVLQALRSCLADQHSFAQVMFTDNGVIGLDFGPSSPHLRILNALEVIAWSPEHLTAVADVLARLDHLDPGGRYANRPSATLASIMCPWMPYTSATADDRLATVRMLRRSHADAAWTLMLSMLPKHHSVQTPGAQPKYRDWRQGEPTVPQREYIETTSAIAQMLVEDVGENPNRWVDLLEHINEVPPDARGRAGEALRRLADAGPDETFKSTVWPKVRETVESHRQFSDAHWTLSEAELAPLDQVLDCIRPADHAVSYGDLFSSGRIHVDGVSAAVGYEEFQAVLRPKQTEAVEAILSGGGLNAVFDFAASVDKPHEVGKALGLCEPTLDVDVLGYMDTELETVTWVALGYFDCRFAALGWDGLNQLLSENDVSPKAAADLMRSPPPIEMPWTRVDALGTDVATAYWDRVSYYDLGIPGELGQLLEVCRRLREANRLGLARWLLVAHADEHQPETEFAEEATVNLEQWIEHPGDTGDTGMMRWELATLLKALDAHREYLGTTRIAVLEWQYHPLLHHDPEFSSPNLYREMLRDPDLFVQFVEFAFKPASAAQDERPTLTTAQQQMALSAMEVLNEWPASRFAPSVDDEDKLDADALNDWIDAVREGLAAVDRADIGDEVIGWAIASSPADPGGEWPSEAVRDLLERLQSDHVDQGLHVTIRNRRGVTSRSPTAGGDQERQLAQNYRQQGHQFTEWPRSAAIFNSLASSYEHDAGYHDRDAESRRRGLPL
ncbi:hypothetical protein [Candidatus Poriferisodalis sp.]|uniref:hypothetical protein n=1 Tax=Candidatus Poriferisodalis sp. TaxID=3101277 RepID=UPI003B5998DA